MSGKEVAATGADDESFDPPRPFLEHISALRDALVGSAIAWLICCVIAGVFSQRVFVWIKTPAKNWQNMIQGLDLTAGVDVIISIVLWGGTALAFPFIAYHVLKFIFPALTKKERTLILGALVAGVGLFGFGVWLAYAQTLPVIINVFQAINEWIGLPVQTVRIEGYVKIVLKTIFAFGLVLQLPVILFLLGWLGVISSEALRRWRRVAIVIIFILGMVLTPPDPMSQIIMAVPLCILYEICVWSVWLKEKACSRKE